MSRPARLVISQEELKRLLTYNPETGVFTWNHRVNSSTPEGSVAGWVADTGYVRISIKNKRFYAHRLAWLYVTGSLPTHDIDHRNQIRSDNSWANLRPADISQNAMNKAGSKPSKLGVKGVRMHPSGRYEAIVRYRRKAYSRTFDNLSDAGEWAEFLRVELHGDFAHHGCRA